jgi:EF-P beta-lysylation protein EpmB
MSQWQLELKNAVTNYSELFKLIDLEGQVLSQQIIDQKFPLLVTRSFIKRMRHNDINDPLLLQILPSLEETTIDNNYLDDPLQEKNFNIMSGLIHKYSGRVLILGSKSCAINCRYCFRKHFPYNSNIASGINLVNIINYIKADNSIEEVILSGGDPLLAPNNYFKKLLDQLNLIKHINTIRIHSRIPIVLPSRLEQEFIDILLSYRFNIVLVTHSNHPNEINQEVADAFKILNNTRITLLNQSVLLKNINDNADVLANLSRKLFTIGVLPYYLHMLDKVNGAVHFEVSLDQAKKIFSHLSTKIPGYLLPRLAVEQSGAKSKTLIL